MTVLTVPKPVLSNAASAPTKDSAECICDEHRSLATQLGLLDEVADEIGNVSIDVLRRDVDRVYDLIARKILPHEKAERVLRDRLAERDRRHIDADTDHGEARRLVARLAGLKLSLARGDSGGAPAEIRHALYELHALTRLHFADELRICDDARHPTSGVR